MCDLPPYCTAVSLAVANLSAPLLAALNGTMAAHPSTPRVRAVTIVPQSYSSVDHERIRLMRRGAVIKLDVKGTTAPKCFEAGLCFMEQLPLS